ncbi:hypothetical protein HHI36_005086 [Cryptolaemus montrouzieri]|uniref:DDE-1 domain-containing protein n=1 Tax=Cryptolaemus montrouzieri TaxID=559131 RepID=A0ABD2NT46_9CUCU
MPDKFWNCDEMCLSYVVKPTKIVTFTGKRYNYDRAYVDRRESRTLMGCICANGSWISPMIIFKGVRWNDALKTNFLPDAQVKLLPKGWTYSELFLEWFLFLLEQFLLRFLLYSSWIHMPHRSILR